jgi:nicotinate phosphoribosyltransferase
MIGSFQIAALRGYSAANKNSLSLWEQTYPPLPSNALHIALTDTFTSASFFKEVLADPEILKRWRGVRQDSGDPIAFAKEAKEVYEALGIDVSTKTLVFSDSLDLKTSLEINRANDKIGFQGVHHERLSSEPGVAFFDDLDHDLDVAFFGVGTSLTNDFKSLSTGEKSKALNIVIKLAEIDGKPCVKLSDDKGKVRFITVRVTVLD